MISRTDPNPTGAAAMFTIKPEGKYSAVLIATDRQGNEHRIYCTDYTNRPAEAIKWYAEVCESDRERTRFLIMLQEESHDEATPAQIRATTAAIMPDSDEARAALEELYPITSAEIAAEREQAQAQANREAAAAALAIEANRYTEYRAHLDEAERLQKIIGQLHRQEGQAKEREALAELLPLATNNGHSVHQDKNNTYLTDHATGKNYKYGAVCTALAAMRRVIKQRQQEADRVYHLEVLAAVEDAAAATR